MIILPAGTVHRLINTGHTAVVDADLRDSMSGRGAESIEMPKSRCGSSATPGFSYLISPGTLTETAPAAAKSLSKSG